jgi:hypothetical protein
MCQICLFCKFHPLHHPLHSCPCPPDALSSFFLLCFILAPCLPLISGNFGASLPVPYCVHVHVACCYTVLVVCWYDNSTLPCLHPSLCQTCLFCELHIDHFLPQTSLSSFFLSLSASCSTPVLLPLIPGEIEHCCLVICDCTMMNLVIAFFLLLVRHYRIVCTYSTGCMVR